MVIYSQLCRTLSRHFLSISDDGGFTTLLGSFNSNLESCSSTDPCLHPSGYIKTEKPSIYNMLYSRKAMFLGRCTLANFLRSPPHFSLHLTKLHPDHCIYLTRATKALCCHLQRSLKNECLYPQNPSQFLQNSKHLAALFKQNP